MPDSTVNEQRLDGKLSQLEQARSWSPRVISKLETFIRTSDDFELFRVNPLHYATEKGMTEAESVDLFLHAAKIGLFEMDWLVMCRYCPNVIESLHDLSKMHPHYICQFCRAENETTLDEYIQVAFTVHPQVRENIFLHPERLSVEDFYLRYAFAKGFIPPDGFTAESLLAFLTKGFLDIPPGESRSVDLDLPPGRFEISDLSRSELLVFFVNPPADPAAVGDAQRAQVRIDLEGKYRVNPYAIHEQEATLGLARFKWDQVATIDSGKHHWQIENLSGERAPLWLLQYPPGFVPYAQPYEPFLTANHLLTTQTFRDLFRSQVINADEGLSIRDITILFTDLKGSTALYEEIGDAKAFFLVRQHFDALGRVIAERGGAIVKTIGDAVMAVFDNPISATNAAVEMIESLKVFNETISQELILKVGIHWGHSIAVTLNERIDYFGQTVNIAARVQALAEANEVYLTADVYAAPGVSETLKAHHVTSQRVQVKGISEKLDVYRISTPS